MAEAFGTSTASTVTDAVLSITSWKPTPTPGNEQPKALSPTIGKADRLESSDGSNSRRSFADSPTAVPRSAIAPTSSMEVGLGDIIQHTAQQSTSRRFSFKAPSSTGDLAAGFSYAKAVPPQWNLSRQKGANQNNHIGPGTHMNNATHRSGPDLPSDPEPTLAGPPLSPKPKAPDAPIDTPTAPNRSTTAAQTSVSETIDIESLPRVSEPAMRHGSSSPTPFAVHVATPQPSSHPKATAPKHLEQIVEDTVMLETEKEKQSTQPPRLTEAFSQQQMGNKVTTPKQTFNRPMRIPKPCNHEYPAPGTSSPYTPKKLRGSSSRSRVTKSPRHSRVSNKNRSRIDLDDLTSRTSVTEEDLLQVLLARYSRDKQERENMRANHATEIRELETLSHSLWQRLQECQQEAQDQEIELSGFRAREPRFTSQIKKLTNYVNGLTNDQQRLRDSFTTMERMHSMAHESKQEIEANLEDVRGVVVDVDKRTINALKDAGHELTNLARIVRDQKSQLQKDAELIKYERERSQRLEIEVGKINTSQQHAMHTFAGHANLVSEKMNNVLINVQEVRAVRQPESLEEVKTALGQCLGSLDELRQAPNVKLEQFSDFEGSMKTIANGITNTLQSYHDDVKSSGLHDQGLVAGMREQLDTLVASTASEHELREQMKDITTKKAEVDVKLCFASESLQQARQQVATIDSERRDFQGQVATLESEAVALRSEPKESAATTARLAEIKAQNEKLQNHIESLKQTTEECSTDLRSKFEDHANFQLTKEDLEGQLRKEQEKANKVANERLELERKANVEFEDMRSKLILAAKFDKNQLWAEHGLAMAEVEERLREANDRTLKMRVEIEKLTKDQDEWSFTVMEQMKLVAEMRDSKDIAQASCEEKSKTIDDLSKERHELLDYKIATETSVQELQKKLDCTKEELDKKETQVATCQQSLRLGMADMEKKNSEIREHNSRIVWHTSEVRRAQQALQAAKAEYEADIRNVNEIHQTEILSLKKELEAANAIVLAKNSNEDNDAASSRPRRKADRCAVQEMQQVVKESQSQIDFDFAGFHSPQSSQEMLDDGMRYIDPKELGDFDIPPTPEQSSRVGKKTVSFASSEYFRSQIASPSRPRPSYRESRVVEDSQDRLSPIRQPSFETPAYLPRNHSQAGVDNYPASAETSSAASLLRPALKSSNTATKRTTTTASLSNHAGEPKRRRSSTVGPGSLGPILPDTQSPSGSTHRPRRVPRSSATSKAKGDKYAERFAQELNR